MTSPIHYLIRSRVRDLDGFTVRRVLPAMTGHMVGPFIFFDHMGPVTFAPGGGMDVRPHPHIGLATVTYLFDGEIAHRDSLGTVQTIRPGDVNWMVAGRGIAHSERTPAELRAGGPRAHGIQTWIALPKGHEEDEPSFAHHPASTLPLLEFPGARVRVIAGRAFGASSPVDVFSETLYAAAQFDAAATFALPPEHDGRGIYVVHGAINIGDTVVQEGELVVLVAGLEVELRANVDSVVMLLGGETMDGPRIIWWNFVSSSKDRIEHAKEEWRAERFSAIPGETDRIPLPES